MSRAARRAPYTLHRQAERELEQAALDYEAALPGTGARFLDAFEQSMHILCEFTQAAPVIAGQIRAKVVTPARTWPYRIFYRVVRGRPRVLAIAHTKRQPFYWIARH